MSDDGQRPVAVSSPAGGDGGWSVALYLRLGRRRLTAGLVALIFLAILVLGWLDPVGLRAAMRSSDPVGTLFQALVTVVVTGVTLVVTINQLVLSQELGAAGDQRERMQGSLEFRDDVAESIEEPVGPLEPAGFLRALVTATTERADDLAAATGAGVPADVQADVDRFVDTLREDAEAVTPRLNDAEFGTFAVTHAALDYGYSWKLHEARRLPRTAGDSLPEEARSALEDLATLVQHFGVAREHVKTLYFQWELVDLSRGMLLTAVPAIVVAAGMVLFGNNPGTIPGATLGFDNVVWLVAAATSVALLPFALLAATILRIATVAKRTLAIGPFVLRETGGESGDGAE
jgi:hypothetical protein